MGITRLMQVAALGLAGVAGAAGAAPAGEGLPPLSWRCIQEVDAGHHVRCIPQMAPESPPAREPAAARARPDMRPVAERGDAEVLSADAWRVPLHAAPVDPAHVRELLRSVLCGNRVQCAVQYEGAADAFAQGIARR